MNWRIRLLGEVGVTFGMREVTHFESSRVVALLARLALYPERIHPREELIELLWPETEPVIGRHRLRTALSSLRRQLEPPGTVGNLFVVDRNSLRLNPEVFVCDVRELERAIRQKQWQAAKTLAQGPLLLGFYDDWIIAERDRLEALCEALPETSIASSEISEISETSEISAISEPSLAFRPLLPAYLTTFFGRTTDKMVLVEMLRQNRLVTLTGPGGVGKTRLSVEVARQIALELAGAFDQGAFDQGAFDRCAFVALSECFEPSGLTERVRGALGLQGEVDIFEVLIEQKTLLVLDNLEHLLDGGVALGVAELLARLPLLTCLVTSRRTLGVEGEREFVLTPLPMAPEMMSESPAVALFLDRARAVRPDFTLTERNKDDILAIERLLEGVPLAIELAASRIRAYSLPLLREQLTTHFSAFAHTGSRVHKDDHHRSLHAAVNWSWQLLSSRQQHFLAALCIFRKGWTVAAATSVCNEPEAQYLLEELVAASLIVVDEQPNGTMRFRLLEMIRSFLQECLTPEQWENLQQVHRAYFLHWCVSLGCQWHLMSGEAGNIQVALERAVAHGATDQALSLLRPNRILWELKGGAEANLDLLHRTLALPTPSEQMRCAGLLEAGSLLMTIAGERNQARLYLDEALELAQKTKSEALEADVLRAQINLEWVHYGESKETSARIEHALSLARHAGARETEANLLNLCGILAVRRDHAFASAEQFYQQAQTIYEERGDEIHANYVLLNRANAALESGNSLVALEQYGHCRKVCQTQGDKVLEVDVANSIGALLSSLGRWAEAEVIFQGAIQQAWQLGYLYMLGHALWNQAEVLAHLDHLGHQGHAERAARLLGFSEHFWLTHFSALTDDDQGYIKRVRQECVLQMGETQTHLLLGEGRALSLRDAVSLAVG
jgi:predicted ATPase/DNA-binding winged helix-turn-helix (wHTH) protein/tetratricopeptide (TPR) repeat protein